MDILSTLVFCACGTARDRTRHYAMREWPARDDLQPGAHNVKHDALVPVDKILLPPLHIKLGLIKQFVTALDRNGETFQEMRSKTLRG